MGMLIQGASMGLPVTIVSKGGLPVTLVDRTFSRSFDAVSYLGDDLIEMWDAARGDTVTATTDATYTNAVSSWLGLVTGANLAQSTPLLKPTYSPTGLASSPCQ